MTADVIYLNNCTHIISWLYLSNMTLALHHGTFFRLASPTFHFRIWLHRDNLNKFNRDISMRDPHILKQILSSSPLCCWRL